MNWDDLRFFLAVCREGSVTAAGQRLSVNHTTVARRLSALEASLGVRLFDRNRDGYAMTQIAENIYADAEAVEQHTQSIDRAAFGRDAELSGPLALTAPYDFANRVIVPALRQFRRDYPAINIDFLTTTGRLDLAAREADIAVRLTEAPPDYLVGRCIMPLRHGVYASRRYLRSMGDEADVILFRSQTSVPDWVSNHFPRHRISLTADSASSIRNAVAAGLGLARLPCFEADPDRRLVRLDLELTPSKWGIWVLNHVDLRTTARIRACRSFLIETIEASRPLILGDTSTYA